MLNEPELFTPEEVESEVNVLLPYSNPKLQFSPGTAKKNGVVTAGQPAPALTPNDTIFSFLLELESAPKITVVRSNEDKVNIVALINAFIRILQKGLNNENRS
tara:strand:- start:127 stop:435 length:309 start_codon:yes stop_codon:yes gene_type:complete